MIFEDKSTWKYTESFDKEDNVFVIGDIHGKYDALMDAISKNNIKDSDYLIFNGDLINKGKDSIKVLDYVLTRPKTILILGNHEYSFIDLIDNIFKNKLNYESVENIISYQLYKDSMSAQWMDSLGLLKLKEYADILLEKSYLCAEIQTENHTYGIVHAEVPKYDWNCILDNFNQAIWSFNHYNDIETKRNKKIENIDFVIFGHVPVEKPFKSFNSIYIDTLNFNSNGKLTFLKLK